MTYYKQLTYDLRPPIQGGEPIFDGTPGTILPEMPTDGAVCSGPGWHSCRTLAEAYQIAGMWGRPFLVEPTGSCVEAQGKIKSSGLTILRECSAEECIQGIRDLTAPWAGEHTDRLVDSQRAWQVALGRPFRSQKVVGDLLARAIDARGLQWRARFLGDARAAWAAWAWAWAARDAWAAWPAWVTPWPPGDARDARAACDAWDAWAALVVETAALMGWHNRDPQERD